MFPCETKGRGHFKRILNKIRFLGKFSYLNQQTLLI